MLCAWPRAGEQQSLIEGNGAFLTLLAFHIFSLKRTLASISFPPYAFPPSVGSQRLGTGFLMSIKSEPSFHSDLLSQPASASKPLNQGDTRKHRSCHCYQGKKHQSPTATGSTALRTNYAAASTVHITEKTTPANPCLSQLLRPWGRFCKAMRLPRNLKLQPRIITCTSALVLQRLLFVHGCFFHKVQRKQDTNQACPLDSATASCAHPHKEARTHTQHSWPKRDSVFAAFIILSFSNQAERPVLGGVFLACEYSLWCPVLPDQLVSLGNKNPLLRLHAEPGPKHVRTKRMERQC